MSLVMSVIIPVYKVEGYLHKCVDSVLNQIYKNIEVILVDDGSPDNCPQICDQYAQKDNRVKVIHKANGGLSDARNLGITSSTGDYIMFLDSDDYWNGNICLAEIVDNLSESHADILMYNETKYFEKDEMFVPNSAYIDRNRLVNKAKNEAFSYLIQKDLYVACAWNKVIKRDIITNNQLFFIPGLLSEDIEWCARLALHVNTFDAYNKPFYIYRKQRANSITSNVGYKNLLDIKKTFINWMSYARTNIQDTDFKNAYLSYFAYQYTIWIVLAAEVKDNRINKLINEMKKYAYILKYDLNYKVRKVNTIYRIFGYNTTVFVLAMFLKLKR